MITHDLKDPGGGAMVFWSCGNTRRERLVELLSGMGLDDILPAERTEAQALKAAIASIIKDKKQSNKADDFTLDFDVEPHREQGKNGYDVVKIKRYTDRVETTSVYGLKLGDDDSLEVTHGWCDDSYAIERAYHHFKNELGTGAVSGFLVKLAAKLHGVTLREAGGLYWLPKQYLHVYEQVAQKVEEAGGRDDNRKLVNKCYLARTPMDPDLGRAVRDAIIAEMIDECKRLTSELTSGELGDKALENRKEQLGGLMSRVTEYETILGQGLDNIKNVIEAVSSNIAVACMQAL